MLRVAVLVVLFFVDMRLPRIRVADGIVPVVFMLALMQIN